MVASCISVAGTGEPADIGTWNPRADEGRGRDFAGGFLSAFSSQTFKTWFGRRADGNRGRPKVLLFADTFNNYFLPQTARAAVEVLEHAGYQVLVPMEHVCCGRPLYDHGFLEEAKRYLRHVMRVLAPCVEQR